MRFLIASLLALPMFAACDPLLPSAEGTVSLAQGVDATPFTALELRWEATNGERASGDTQRVEAPVFPVEFFLGGGIGETDASKFRLRAWLTDAPAAAQESDRSPGEPYFDHELGVNCSASCSGLENVTIELAP